MKMRFDHVLLDSMGKSKLGKSKQNCSNVDIDGNAFKCCICKRTFWEHKDAVLHSTIHRGQKWVCPRDDCALVVNLSELGHLHLKAEIVRDDDAGTSAGLVDGLSKAEMKKQCNRY